ncbi:MAG: TRAP transporter substrate-binding protein DctP [Methylobacterium sp.]|nr:MAG: TRAP transporter substrate-binding protein DctP [Methylobacterium sp.]
MGLAGGAAAETLPKANITVIGNLGITTQSRQLEAPFWAKRVPEASGGAITANFKPWNELGLKGPELFRILARGQATLAHGQLGHHAGDAPINDGNDLAGMSPDWETFRKATEAFRPVLTAFYEKNLGLRPITMQSYQSQVLYCRPELKGLADLKGKRVRTSGASQGDFIAHFGGIPVDMAFGEVQQALSQGTIDCAITGTLGGYTAKWTGARFLYTLPINYGANAIVANIAEWNRLDPKVQGFLSQELKTLEGEMWALNRSEDEVGIACNTTGPCPLGAPVGMKRVDPSPEDIELRRKALLETVLPRWGQRCGAECVRLWNDTVGKVVNLEAR